MNLTDQKIVIAPVINKAQRKIFVTIGQRFSAATPNSVPQLRSELLELVNPAKNPFFGHARVQLMIAYRGGEPVGRISAHIDELALELPPAQGFGPGAGMFGYFDAEDEDVGKALMSAAEDWLRRQGMTRSLGPISMSIWEEPGLLTRGHDKPPVIMMGHDPAHYQAWIEANDYKPAKKLVTYDIDVSQPFPPIVQRIVQSAKRNPKIRMRNADKSVFGQEVRIILEILNDAWSDNWGFIPFTEQEIEYAAKKLKPIVLPELVKIVELDGVPSAFIITLPDLNEVLSAIGGKLLPFGWFKILRWLRKPRSRQLRVPLMGVLKEYHSTRMASQLAFLMIDEIGRTAFEEFGVKTGEIGWVLEDNKGMISIAETLDGEISREYLIYEKSL
ncbi:N-acetyltransferase [Altererythrobacter gangjinensis]|uniref:N-acetyltransferase n=2 Tax=Pontixanthobacter gangjinensis TaxID=1028742 RepID=A0A6I4SL03_9SPHN|nr:N-acetyltransferase [Pontixanthobacter gangjinensis]